MVFIFSDEHDNSNQTTEIQDLLTEYQSLLSSAAGLSSLGHDLSGRKRLFQSRVCRNWIQKEETVQKMISQLLSNQIASGQAYWWRLRWPQIQPFLQHDLAIGKERYGWRFRYEWVVVEKNGVCYLLLNELGNCSEYSCERERVHDRISEYTGEQQEDMRRNFNKALNRYALFDVLMHDDSPVISPIENLYASRANYYLSYEYYSRRDTADRIYQRSLYTEHEKNTYYIESNSQYYEGAYEVARFQSDGNIRSLELVPFRWLGGEGTIPDFAEKKYADKDPAVSFVSFLSANPQYGSLSLSLFTRGIERESSSFEEAMRLAEIMCCMGKKRKQ